MNYINKGKRDILIIPKFNNIHKIQIIREKYDELFNMIEPHITLAFPFRSNISNEEYISNLKLFYNYLPTYIFMKDYIIYILK